MTTPGKTAVLVPHASGIHPACEAGLDKLESHGIRVVRKAGCSAIDVARNELASEALHGGMEALFFIDSDIGFDPADVLRLLERPELVVSGVYAKKNQREMASVFAEGIKEVVFGPEVPEPYALRYAACGFLRVQAPVLHRMVAELHLPLCNTSWGPGVWPFFQPVIIPHETESGQHYLAEDFAFSWRLRRIGVTPLADTTVRLWHFGCCGFSWEEAGMAPKRYRSYTYRLE